MTVLTFNTMKNSFLMNFENSEYHAKALNDTLKYIVSVIVNVFKGKNILNFYKVYINSCCY